MRPLAILLVSVSLPAQNVLPVDLELLTKIRTRMIFNLEHQPNYTCVETIERTSRAKSTNKPKVIDTVRLEVGVVDGREMFGWPGAKKFEEMDVDKIVTTGAIGNGNFSTHARTLFASRVATFHFRGDAELKGKKAIRFDYDVPQMLSGYKIRVPGASAVVGYHGSFYADSETFDMQRIEVIADHLPPDLMLSETSDIIDYTTMHIGEGDFLLPHQSELVMVDLTGGENRNHVRFTSCRQFSGESVLTFGEAPVTAPDSTPAVTREFELPPGLEIPLLLTAEVDLKTAAIGDPVQARVDRDVKRKGIVVLPKGATAIGRITRLERYENHSIIGVEFPEIEAPGILAQMKGRIDRTLGIPPIRQPHTMTGRTPLQSGEGIFAVPSELPRLSRGCIIVWRT